MLAAAVGSAGIGHLLDHVVSVDEIRRFKPDPAVYQLAVARLGIPASAIAFVSSNGWDAWAAAEFGMRVVWCNRQNQPAERLPGAPDRQVASLAELPALLAAPPG
jgi:2-haloacid dehalogenase